MDTKSFLSPFHFISRANLATSVGRRLFQKRDTDATSYGLGIELMSGRRRGIVASLIRGTLWVAQWAMWVGVTLRNKAWDRGIFHAQRSRIPIISVGNLTAGGTGKTPLVAWLVLWLRAQGLRAAILSRGYGAKGPGRPNDEALELAARFRHSKVENEDPNAAIPSPPEIATAMGRRYERRPTDVSGVDRKMMWMRDKTEKNTTETPIENTKNTITIPHLQRPDRVASVREIESGIVGKIDRIVLDDGFQHRRLARDLEIVLLDATEPFGYGYLLPRGLLREPIRNLRRVGNGMVILTRADQVSDARRQEIRERVARIAPQAGWAELTQRAVNLIDSTGNERPLTDIAGKSVVAICGIGNPRAFLDGTLRECNVLRMDERIFPDHHFWTDSEKESLVQWIRNLPQRPEAVLCTGKDIVRWPGVTELDGVPLLAVQMEPVWLTGREELERRLDIPSSQENLASNSSPE